MINRSIASENFCKMVPAVSATSLCVLESEVSYYLDKFLWIGNHVIAIYLHSGYMIKKRIVMSKRVKGSASDPQTPAF